MHQEKLMKQAFALNKANHFVLEEGSRILSTLIPDNVWSKFRAIAAEDNRANAFSGYFFLFSIQELSNQSTHPLNPGCAWRREIPCLLNSSTLQSQTARLF
jgi:hypothetical protein